MRIRACLILFCMVTLLTTSCDGIPTSISSVTNTDSGIPRIDRLSPSSGGPGIELTIYGQNFESIPVIQMVTFGTRSAETISWSDTEIVVKVPYGTGTVDVSVGPNPRSNSISFRLELHLPQLINL